MLRLPGRLLKRALDIVEVSRSLEDSAVCYPTGALRAVTYHVLLQLPLVLHELAKVTHEIAFRRRHLWGALKAAAESEPLLPPSKLVALAVS